VRPALGLAQAGLGSSPVHCQTARIGVRFRGASCGIARARAPRVRGHERHQLLGQGPQSRAHRLGGINCIILIRSGLRGIVGRCRFVRLHRALTPNHLLQPRSNGHPVPQVRQRWIESDRGEMCHRLRGKPSISAIIQRRQSNPGHILAASHFWLRSCHLQKPAQFRHFQPRFVA